MAVNAYQRALLGLHPLVASRDDDRAYAGLVDALAQLGRRAEACEQASAWRARRPKIAEAWAAVEKCS